jgi:hypothetical protein
MIGVHFKPGGATAFLDLPADEFRNQVSRGTGHDLERR